jgi:small-conductance mechanosensitive channel
MDDIAELEARITAALGRLGRAMDALAALPPPAGAAAVPDAGAADAAERARLAAALEEERMANAQLGERVKALRERQDATVSGLETRLATLTTQLDTAAIEAQRLRKVNVQLRETVHGLREAAAAGLAEPHLVNKTMLAELEALRAARAADLAEMDQILSALDPIVGEAEAGNAGA